VSSDGNLGRKIGGYAVLAISLVIAYQAYVNSTLTPELQELSKDAAQTISTVDEDRPRMKRSDPIQQRYEWHTAVGPVLVQCRRDLVFFGDWTCVAEQGTMGAF
jgi:hypothetical protein